jgi:CBS domain-containing protein
MITKAKDIMTTELIIAHPEMTVDEAIRIMVNNKITGMPVVDKSKKLIGIVSEYDVMKVAYETSGLKVINLSKPIHFTKEVLAVDEDAPLKDIVHIFVDKKIRRIPVLNKNKDLVGLITRRDIMRVLFYRSKKI